MNEAGQQALRRPPHPMGGYIAVIALPAPPEPDGGQQAEPAPAGVELKMEGGPTVHLHDLRSLLRPQQGIEAAIVMEVGPLPPSTDSDVAEIAVPYAEGCTVYYYAERAIKIGDFRYVRWDHVLAWEEAPR